MDKKKQKKTLKGYYEALPFTESPKTNFVTRIAAKCGVSANAVRNWIHYGVRPLNPAHSEILSEETGIPVEELWQE